MLDCKTQDTNHGPMPSDIYNVYVQYKQDTRAIIAWLVSHGPSKYKRFRTLYIKDLFDLAEIVQNKTVEMPEIIAFHFREAIAARTYMSRFFKGTSPNGADDHATINHEYFTTRQVLSLTKMYAGLCECCAQPPDVCRREHQARPSQVEINTSNRFSTLHTSYPNQNYPLEDESHVRMSKKEAEDTDHAHPRPDSYLPRLVDDKLGENLELLKEIDEMSDLSTTMKDIWEGAAKGEVPLVLAAFINNAASACFEEIEQRLRINCNISHPETLRRKLMQAREDVRTTTKDDGGSSRSAILLVQILDRWRHLLEQLKSEGPSNLCNAKARTFQWQLQLTVRKSPESAAMDEECHTVLLQTIAQCIQYGGHCTSIVRQGSPVFPEVGYYLTHTDDKSNTLRCSYGLQLLLDSYKGYLFTLKPPVVTSSCRLQALKFAQEVISSVQAALDDSTMPCRCPGTLASHLESLHRDLKAFLHTKLFDFYFQSPWVCGAHVLEMLDALFYYGLRLFSYRNIVGSVVHMYNVLRQFTDTESIPLLDGLSTTFSEIVFPGGRPFRNFKASYMRYMGGRLRFHSSSSTHRSGCHSMAIPAHAAKTTAGFGTREEAIKDPRFDYRKISLLYHIKDTGYHPDLETWKRVLNLGNSGAESRFPKVIHSHSCSHHLEQDPSLSSHRHRLHSLRRAIFSVDFSGPFPIAKIDLFKVYLSCARIVSTISDKFHGEDSRPGQYCLCSVEALLMAADQSKDNEHKLQPLGCKELVEVCRGALVDVLKGEILEQYFWKHV